MKTDLPTPSKATKCYYCKSNYRGEICPNCGASEEALSNLRPTYKRKRGLKTILIITLVSILITSLVLLKAGVFLSQPANITTREMPHTSSSEKSLESQNNLSSINSTPVFTLSAVDIVLRLQQEGLPIDNITEYDENTDPNGNLGRPNQYIQKVNFADTRLEQSDENHPLGGTVEVFQNHSDAKARYDYIVAISKAVPSTGYYCHLQGNILLRLTFDLTPAQDDEYNEIFRVFCAQQA